MRIFRRQERFDLRGGRLVLVLALAGAVLAGGILAGLLHLAATRAPVHAIEWEVPDDRFPR